MKIGDILDKISGVTDGPIGLALSVAFPAFGIANQVLGGINKILPKSISENTTVAEVREEIQKLDLDSQYRLLSQEINLEVVKSNNYLDLSLAQENNKSSVRPEVVIRMSKLFEKFAYISLLFLIVAMIFDTIIVLNGKKAFIFDIAMTGMPWLAATYALPAMEVIRQYFARRSEDKKVLATASLGQIAPSSTGFLQGLAGVFSKK
jgi:hypothetical protein